MGLRAVVTLSAPAACLGQRQTAWNFARRPFLYEFVPLSPLFEGLGAKREPEKCEREQTGPGMVLVIDKRTVHVQVPDSSVISFSSSKNFSLQIWYSCEAVFTCVRVLTVSEVLS